MSGRPFTLLVDIPLKPGRADEFMALFNEVFEAMKVEETFISATALRGAEDGAAFWGIRELYAKDRFTIDLGWCAASRASFPRIGRRLSVFPDPVPVMIIRQCRQQELFRAVVRPS